MMPWSRFSSVGIRVVIVLLAALTCVFRTAAADRPATITVHADRPGAKIDRHIFGQFAEHLGTGIYGGIWVGLGSPIPNTRGYRNDVLAALRKLKVPVIRWPGGCFADEYNWREGIGPRDNRPVKVNTNWGGVTEPNSFGTHEFMDLAELIGAEAYVSGNVGDGSPRDLAEWVEYMTAPAGTLADMRAKNGRKLPWKLAYFGLGNELWGCGGNMRAEYAADVTRRYSTFVKVPAGATLVKMASGASADDYHWTEVMMRDAATMFDGIGVHYYTLPGDWKAKGSATGFDEDAYARTLSKSRFIEELIAKHAAIMDRFDPGKRVAMAVDEWGTWYDPTPGSNPGFLQQQNTVRDAVVAALAIDIFSRHGDRLRMANIAQMVNVLQAMILTNGPKMLLTPTYHVFEMYTPFQDATVLPVDIGTRAYARGTDSLPQVDAIAAVGQDGHVYVALVNVDPSHPADIALRLAGRSGKGVTGRVLRGASLDAHNNFAAPEAVRPVALRGLKLGEGNVLRTTLPPESVAVLGFE